METLMKVDAAVVKRLREEKSWSQEHLATVAGVSHHGQDAGAAYGMMATLTGITCAVIGVVANRLWRLPVQAV